VRNPPSFALIQKRFKLVAMCERKEESKEETGRWRTGKGLLGKQAVNEGRIGEGEGELRKAKASAVNLQLLIHHEMVPRW